MVCGKRRVQSNVITINNLTVEKLRAAREALDKPPLPKLTATQVMAEYIQMSIVDQVKFCMKFHTIENYILNLIKHRII